MKRSTVLKLTGLMLASFVTVLPQQALAQAKAKFSARIGHLEAPTQPRHQGLPMNPGGPHHGRSGSPHPSATQPSAGPGMPTRTETPGAMPKNATSAGA